VIGTALATAFFASPAKPYLIKKLNVRSGATAPKLQRTYSQESLANDEPILGLPPDPQGEVEEFVTELRAEMEARQRKGIKRAETMPAVHSKPL
jgi:lysophospholipid acyltransferase